MVNDRLIHNTKIDSCSPNDRSVSSQGFAFVDVENIFVDNDLKPC